MSEPTNIVSPAGEATTALNLEEASATQTVYEPEVRTTFTAVYVMAVQPNQDFTHLTL